jgi:glycosyltransferase involved in cell wall biosynthesis
MRPLRILHVGNIANNALINATLLIERGHICHVACYDFYHFAGCSEWYNRTEDISATEFGDPLFPNFWTLGERRPPVPRWFAQGRQARVLTYLHYLARGEQHLADIAWACLQYSRFKAVLARDTSADNREMSEAEFQAAIAALPLAKEDRRTLFLGRSFERIWQQVRDASRRVATNVAADSWIAPVSAEYLDAFAEWSPPLKHVIDSLRPRGVLAAAGIEWDAAMLASGELPTGATRQDTAAYDVYLPQWRALFRLYDVVICYGPDPIIPYLANDRAYIAYEHGTLRDIPFEDSTLGRLVNQAYTAAFAVFVTNNDYITQPRKLALRSDQLHYLPHPFDERPPRAFAAKHGRNLPPIVTFFGPARQDWVKQYPTLTKNNDFVVRAVRRLKDGGIDNFKVVFVEWGVDVEATRRLIRELGVEDHFEWVAPMSKRQLWKRYLDSHAVIDQFLLPSLSGVSFEAMALGCRVITNDDGVSNKTAFEEQPPLLSASDVDTVEARMSEIIADPADVRGIGRQSAQWVDRRHSAERIVTLQEGVFESLLRHSRPSRAA